MSYSFTVRAATKAEALRQVADELDAVVDSQPAHKAARASTLAMAKAFVGMLADDDTKDVEVSVNSYLAGREDSRSGAGAGVATALVFKVE